MAPKPIAVLMIEDDPNYAELVQHRLTTSSEEVGFTLDWTDTLAGGFQRLARGGVDVVLLDLNLPDSRGVETFLLMRDRAEGIPIVVLSADDNEPQALQLIQKGAENYLFKNSSDHQLLIRALRYAVIKRSHAARPANDISEQRATVVGVLAAKGGSGATTVACNLTAELHRQTEKSALLMDLDRDGGLASFLSGLEPKYALDRVIENLNRLDRSVWDSMVTRTPLDYHLVCAPPSPSDDGVNVDNVKSLLVRLSLWYGWIVLDLGRLGNFSAGLLDTVDQLIVVSKTALPDLYQARLTIERLRRVGIDREKIRLMLNETGRKSASAYGELRSIFGTDVFAAIPDASEELESSCLKKSLPPESGLLRREMGNVARRLAGLPEVKPKGMLLSLTQRFRKPVEGEEAVVASGEKRRVES